LCLYEVVRKSRLEKSKSRRAAAEMVHFRPACLPRQRVALVSWLCPRKRKQNTSSHRLTSGRAYPSVWLRPICSNAPDIDGKGDVSLVMPLFLMRSSKQTPKQCRVKSRGSQFPLSRKTHSRVFYSGLHYLVPRPCVSRTDPYVASAPSTPFGFPELHHPAEPLGPAGLGLLLRLILARYLHGELASLAVGSADEAVQTGQARPPAPKRSRRK